MAICVALRMAVVTAFVAVMVIWSGQSVSAEIPKWNYNLGTKYGPNAWKESYPNCKGEMQSPIDIGQAKFDLHLRPMELKGYNTTKGLAMTLSNTKYSANLHYSGTPIYIQGGLLDGKYALNSLDFHWRGETPEHDCGHHIGKKYFPMEMHLTHSNSEDKVAIISYFFEITTTDNPHLKPLLSKFKNIVKYESRVPITDFKLGDLVFDISRKNYYCGYQGSHTTPPCGESILWTVMTRPLSISQAQMNTFLTLTGPDGKQIAHNFRPMQNLNTRLVTTNDPDFASSGKASSSAGCVESRVMSELPLLLLLCSCFGFKLF